MRTGRNENSHGLSPVYRWAMPARFAGVGNAYSDEILYRARLSPLKRAGSLTSEETGRLHAAAESVLTEWAARLQEECGSAFPTGVTAFRGGMAVHGRFGQPCPDCGSPVQRIRRAENEFNYCATCQTGGRLLADRAMSRLLRKKWPRTLKAAEERRRRLRTPESGSSSPDDRGRSRARPLPGQEGIQREDAEDSGPEDPDDESEDKYANDAGHEVDHDAPASRATPHVHDRAHFQNDGVDPGERADERHQPEDPRTQGEVLRPDPVGVGRQPSRGRFLYE